MGSNLKNNCFCKVFLEEFAECKKQINKVYHYYTYGHSRDINCQVWKKNYDNCVLWISKKDEKAKEKMISSENTRANNVFKNQTSVWKYRLKPPEMWDFPGYNNEPKP